MTPGLGIELKVDGNKVFVATGGIKHDPALPSVVFVHGASLDHSVWALQARYFARRGRNVFAVDMPGHGRSQGAPLQGIPELGNWLIQVLDAADVEQAALVGHSMGSLVTFEAAVQQPQRMRALVMLGTSIPMPVGEPLLLAAKNNDYAAFDMITIFGHSYSARLASGQAPGMWAMGAGFRLLERAAPGVLHTDFAACNAYQPNLEQAAAKIDFPLMLILGDQDAMTPTRAAKSLIDALPDAETIVLKDCGHMMISEQPEPVLDALIKIV